MTKDGDGEGEGEGDGEGDGVSSGQFPLAVLMITVATIIILYTN